MLPQDSQHSETLVVAQLLASNHLREEKDEKTEKKAEDKEEEMEGDMEDEIEEGIEDTNLSDVLDGEGVGGELVEQVGGLLDHGDDGPGPLLLAHGAQGGDELLGSLVCPPGLAPPARQLEPF